MKPMVFALNLALAGTWACRSEPASAPDSQAAPNDPTPAVRPDPGPDPSDLRDRAQGLFGTVAPQNTTEAPEVESARVELGRMLYYEDRLSKNHDVSCNTCHELSAYGVDVRERDGRRIATSKGHKDAFGVRNSPSTYNAFVHVSQFWDGRAPDVEAQAKGPVLNPVEMAMPSPAYAVKVLRSIPGYGPLFAAAFPDSSDPITYDNMAIAIGAFERKLVTPSPFDAFLNGELGALSEPQLEGLQLFIGRCASCHMGPGIGGAIYQKLGLMKTYETPDPGRYDVTKKESDRRVFKVPSLRNVAETAPYLHDGSVADLRQMVSIMGKYQTAQGDLTDDETSRIVTFLKALTGQLPQDLITPPERPPSGPRTPRPDPS